VPVRDEDAERWVSCPRCGVVVYLPPEEGIQAPPARRAAPPGKGGAGKPLGEGVEVPDLETRFRKQEARARRRYLRGVNSGLAFHYVAPFLFLAGTGAGVLGLVLTVSARAFEWENAVAAASFFFRAGGLFLFLTGAASIPAAFFGLLGASANGGGRATLLACLGLLGIGCASAASLVAFPGFGPGFFALGLATTFGAWIFWVTFLRGLGPSLGRQEVAEEALRTLLGGLKTLAISLPILLVVGFLVAAMVKRPILITVIPATFVGAVVTLAYHFGNFESILSMLLAPTGIPFVLDYLNFVAGLRMLIQRRS
jgi:hypothetical protein